MFSDKEKAVIEEALQLLWDERGLDYLTMDDEGKYINSGYPEDANLANTISDVWEHL